MIRDLAAKLKAEAAAEAGHKQRCGLELEALATATEIISNPNVSASYAGHINMAQTYFMQMTSSSRRALVKDKAAALLQKRATALKSQTLMTFASLINATRFSWMHTMSVLAQGCTWVRVPAFHWCDICFMGLLAGAVAVDTRFLPFLHRHLRRCLRRFGV